MTSNGTTPGKPTSMRALGALSWLVVLGMSLATSWWSLYAVARHYGVPPILAVGFSSIFDGAALILADLQRRYAETEDSGLVPRLLLTGVVVGSVALNRQHAVLMHYDWPGQIAFAAPAAVAIALFEVEMRWRHRVTLRKNGRVAEALPALGRWQWTVHLFQSIATVYTVTRARGRAARQREMARIEARLSEDLAALNTAAGSGGNSPGSAAPTAASEGPVLPLVPAAPESGEAAAATPGATWSFAAPGAAGNGGGGAAGTAASTPSSDAAIGRQDASGNSGDRSGTGSGENSGENSGEEAAQGAAEAAAETGPRPPRPRRGSGSPKTVPAAGRRRLHVVTKSPAAWIEDYLTEHDTEPTGKQVGEAYRKSARWGRDQLAAYRQTQTKGAVGQ